jgi:hypothetical protein
VWQFHSDGEHQPAADRGNKMRKFLLIATGIALTTLQLAHSQDDSIDRRTSDTELFVRGTNPSDPHYARVDRFDQLFDTHSSPGGGGDIPGGDIPGGVPDRWWAQ